MKNVGSIDRIIRYVGAAVLIVAGIFSGGVTRYILWGISLVPILTATFQFCPLWLPFKINTYKK
jgi:hypothetical protein